MDASASPQLPDPRLPDPGLPGELAVPASGGSGTAWVYEFDLSGLLGELGIADLTNVNDDGADALLLAAEPFQAAGNETGSSRWTSVDLSGRIAESLPAGPGLAAWLARARPEDSADRDLAGIASAFRRLASWAQAGELAAVAELAARCAAANPRVGVDSDGQPRQLLPDAAAQVALEETMTQQGAMAWASLAVRLRWQLRHTGAALADGAIDLTRAKIIAEATAVLSDQAAQQVEDQVLAAADGQTYGQLRTSVHRAVIAADPDGAERRRQEAERHAKLSLYPDVDGTATLLGSSLPGVHAAAAMARISAMARALKASGASGGLDLLRASIYLGLLLGTSPLIPPPEGAPPDEPPPDDGQAPGESTPHGARSDNAEPAGGQPDDAANHAPREYAPGEEAPGEEAPRQEAPRQEAARQEAAREDAPREIEPDGGQACPWEDVPPPGDEDAPIPDDNVREPDIGPAGWAESAPEDESETSSASRWPPLPAMLAAGLGLPADSGGRSPAGPLAGNGKPGAPPVGLLDLLIPWRVLIGAADVPAVLGRLGPLTNDQTWQVVDAAMHSHATQWRVIVTDDDGRCLAVERARIRAETAPGPPGPPGPPGRTGIVGRVTVTIPAGAVADAVSRVGAGSAQLTADCSGSANAERPASRPSMTRPNARTAILVALARAAERAARRAQDEARALAVAGGCCDQATASAAYRPPPRIREHIAARDHTCRFRTCGQPAWRADLDHTIPYDQGGPTCGCNLGGDCRTHHKIKQLPGWHLQQVRPGYFIWTTPAGRSYSVSPDRYPI